MNNPKINYVLKEEKDKESKDQLPPVTDGPRTKEMHIKHSGAPMEEVFKHVFQNLIVVMELEHKGKDGVDTVVMAMGEGMTQDGRKFQIQMQLTTDDAMKLPIGEIATFGPDEKKEAQVKPLFKTPHGQA